MRTRAALDSKLATMQRARARLALFVYINWTVTTGRGEKGRYMEVGRGARAAIALSV